MLRDDVRIAISPQVGEWNGRDEVANALRAGMTSLGVWRVLPTAANGQPAAAGYLCRPGQTTFEPFAICLLNFQDGQLVDIAALQAADLIAAFGLPASPVTTASERCTAPDTSAGGPRRHAPRYRVAQ